MSDKSPNKSKVKITWFALIPYLISGIVFGIIAMKSEIVSWYRIQEMFRFQSFHMYGVIGSAVATAMLATWLIKKFNLKSFNGEQIIFHDKATPYTRYIVGGIFFGLGWALVGACPGPIFALFGAGYAGYFIVFLGAALGAGTYAFLRSRLPH